MSWGAGVLERSWGTEAHDKERTRLKQSWCLSLQSKLLELQAGKKSLEDQVEMLRTVKEEAEKPEKEAKDQHRKLWEGMLWVALQL